MDALTLNALLLTFMKIGKTTLKLKKNRSMEMNLTGIPMGAAEAASRGLVSKVCWFALSVDIPNQRSTM